MTPQEMDDFKKLAGTLIAGGQLTQRVKSVEQAVTIMAKGMEVGMLPMEALRQIYCVNGVAAIMSDGIRALLFRAGTVQIIDEVHTPTRAVVRMVRRNKDGQPIAEFAAEWTMERAKAAGLVKPGVWTQYPETMLRHRATAEAGRAVGSDILGGMYAVEEFGVANLDQLTAEVVSSTMIDADGIGEEAAKALGRRAKALIDAGRVSPEDLTAFNDDRLRECNKQRRQDMTPEEIRPLEQYLAKLEAQEDAAPLPEGENPFPEEPALEGTLEDPPTALDL